MVIRVFWMLYVTWMALAMGPRPVVVQKVDETEFGVDAHNNNLGVVLGRVQGDDLLGAVVNDDLGTPLDLFGVAVADGVARVLIDHTVGGG